MWVIVAPGQGSQKPGFLSPWLADSAVRDSLERWSEIVGQDLVAHGTTSDAETIRDTQIAQPLIVAAGLITGRRVQERLATSSIGYAGHSVGELTALALSGVLSDDDAMRLVAVRGAAMAQAAALEPTGMSAVLGMELDALTPDLEARGLVAANVNGAGQVVAAGPLPALAELQASPPEGARVIALQVAGAFHTHFMQSALDAVRELAQTILPGDPVATLYSNFDGQAVDSGQQALDRVVGQLVSPVRWDLCMESFHRDGIEALVELAPAGALVGLAKRALPGVETRKIDLPEHLETLRQES